MKSWEEDLKGELEAALSGKDINEIRLPSSFDLREKIA